jgi:RHS repeat-associated protein
MAESDNGEIIWFQYSDEGLIAEYKDSTLIKLYGWQPQGLWGSEPLWQADISGSQKITYYQHVDNLGTSQRLTDKDGKLTWAMQSEAFGETTVPATAAAENNLRFPGQYYDEETGLHYNYFRDYSSVTGRYIQTDPIGLEGGLNVYVYVRNAPLENIDVKGLQSSDPRLPCVNPKKCSPFAPDQFYCAKAMGNCKESCLSCCALLQLRGYAQGPCNVECKALISGCGESCPPTNFHGDSCCI